MREARKVITFKMIVEDYEALDPMDVDLTYVEHVCSLIPSDGYIDMNSAEELATQFLAGANHCADLISRVACYYGKCETDKRAAKASAISKLLDKGQSGTVAKEMYGNNTEYIDASNRQVIADSLLKLLENKRDSMLRAHFLCRDLLRSHKPQEGAADWESSSTFGKDFQDEPNKPTPSKKQKSKTGKKSQKFKSEISWDQIGKK